MFVPSGICFPASLNVSLDFVSENFETLGRIKLFPSGADFMCILLWLKTRAFFEKQGLSIKLLFVFVGVMYSGEYDVCGFSECASTPGKLKSLPDHGGNRNRDL
jgi:hypothetical protein